ncbi:MAG: hypothetical protein ACQER7_09185 [Bacteroidota bacterium]
MKRHYNVNNNAADALLPVLFRQSSNAREGWCSKEVVISILQFNYQNTENYINSSAHVGNQQRQQH